MYTAVKFIKWFISISAFIVGVFFLQMASETGEIFHTGLGIFSLGLVYIMSKSTFDAPKKILMGTAFVMLIAGIAAHLFFSYYTYVYLGGDFFLAWWLCTLALGLPVMSYIFYTTDD